VAEREIAGLVERRRKWTAEEKAALLAKVEAEGGIAGQQYEISSLSDPTPCGFDLADGTIAVAVSETGSILIEGSRPGTPLPPEASCLLTPAAPVNGVPTFERWHPRLRSVSAPVRQAA
jgi:hypothetical protein